METDGMFTAKAGLRTVGQKMDMEKDTEEVRKRTIFPFDKAKVMEYTACIFMQLIA